jgi:hypothetical protein
MSSINRQLSLARSIVGCRCHVCAFFDSSKDEHEVLLPFVAEGLARGDRVLQVIDRHDRQERLRLMAENGMNVDAAERAGTLALIDWDDSYLRGGRFDQDAMLELVDEIGSNVATQPDGVTRGITRAWADMGWSVRGIPGAQDVAEYEARLNYILPKYDMAVVCAYDVAGFDVDLFTNILRAHPYVIIGGILRQNLFYVPPDELLTELKQSKRRRNVH